MTAETRSAGTPLCPPFAKRGEGKPQRPEDSKTVKPLSLCAEFPLPSPVFLLTFSVSFLRYRSGLNYIMMVKRIEEVVYHTGWIML